MISPTKPETPEKFSMNEDMEFKDLTLVILAYIIIYIAVCCIVFENPKEMEDAAFYYFQMTGRWAISGWAF